MRVDEEMEEEFMEGLAGKNAKVLPLAMHLAASRIQTPFRVAVAAAGLLLST